MSDIFNNLDFTEKDLIENLIANNFIVDYGFIENISDDKKFVDVRHVCFPKTRDGKNLEKTVTKNVELLFTGSKDCKFIFDVEKDDGVLLIGLKNYVKQLGTVTDTIEQKYLLHYKQENLKAIPFSFANDPKTLIQILKDEIKIESEIKNTTIDLKDKLTIETDAEFELTANNKTIKTSNNGVAIKDENGNAIAIDNALIDLHNSVSDLKSQLQDLWSAIISINNNLQSWTSTNALIGSPVTPNPATIALFVADNVTANTKKSAVANFLK